MSAQSIDHPENDLNQLIAQFENDLNYLLQQEKPEVEALRNLQKKADDFFAGPNYKSLDLAYKNRLRSTRQILKEKIVDLTGTTEEASKQPQADYKDSEPRPQMAKHLEEAEKIMDNAEAAFYAGKYSEAIKLYEQVLKIEPDWERATKHKQEAQNNLDNGIVPHNVLPPKAATLFGKAQSAEKVMRYDDALKMVMEAKELVNKAGTTFWKDGDELVDSLQKKADAFEVYKEGVNLFKQGQIQDAIEKITLAKNATNQPLYVEKLKEYTEFRTSINKIRTAVVGTNIAPEALSSALEDLETLEGDNPNHPNLVELRSKIEFRLPTIQATLFDDLCALKERARTNRNLNDALGLIKQARQKIVTIKNFGGFEGLNEQIQEIEKLGSQIQADIEVLTRAEESLETSSRWPASVWTQTEGVRRRRSNDPRVSAIVQRMSIYSTIRSSFRWLLIGFGVVLIGILIWWSGGRVRDLIIALTPTPTYTPTASATSTPLPTPTWTLTPTLTLTPTFTPTNTPTITPIPKILYTIRKVYARNGCYERYTVVGSIPKGGKTQLLPAERRFDELSRECVLVEYQSKENSVIGWVLLQDLTSTP